MEAYQRPYFMKRHKRNIILGQAEAIGGMMFGTRYKYNRGIIIDHVINSKHYHVFRVGQPSIDIGQRVTLEQAKDLAVKYLMEQDNDNV